MTTEKYNGWTNYETWAVNLHIGNDQGSYEYWQKSQAEESYQDVVEGDQKDGNRESWTEDAATELADRMKTEFTDEGACPLLKGSSVYTDLLNAALSEVNWYEIAKNYIEELDRDEIERDTIGEPEVE